MNQPQLNHSQSNIDSISPPASDVIVRKGDNSFADAYSAFMDNSGTLHTTLDAELRSLITHQPSTYHRLHTNRLPTISCIPPHLTYRPFKHTHSHTHTHTHHPSYLPPPLHANLLHTTHLKYRPLHIDLLHTTSHIPIAYAPPLTYQPLHPPLLTFQALAHTSQPLLHTIRAAGVSQLLVAGIATDYCVHRSCVDALNLGYEVFPNSRAPPPLVLPSTSPLRA